MIDLDRPLHDSPSDSALAGRVADVVATPRHAAADSFVLHAPLELLARTALLRFVDDDRRGEARQRIVDLGAAFAAAGDAVRPPERIAPVSVADGVERLTDAITRGELDDVDAAAAWLGAAVRPRDLAPLLADAWLPLLGAAGHAPIFLWLYPRVSPQGDLTATLLRQLCRELARVPDWRLHWIDDLDVGPTSDPSDASDLRDRADPGGSLFDALASVPVLGRPASTFIFPLMSRVDRADRAGTLGPLVGPQLGDGAVEERGRAVLRAAAWSMLDEPGDDAPYGWSHCLTMPQAVLGVAGATALPTRGLAIAATYVYGFRASLASHALRTDVHEQWRAEGDRTLAEAIADGPFAARAAAWHLSDDALRSAIGTVATCAATHHDAHLVKYVLACLDAAVDDPPARRLYVAAAATLCGWWAARPEGIDIA